MNFVFALILVLGTHTLLAEVVKNVAVLNSVNITDGVIHYSYVASMEEGTSRVEVSWDSACDLKNGVTVSIFDVRDTPDYGKAYNLKKGTADLKKLIENKFKKDPRCNPNFLPATVVLQLPPVNSSLNIDNLRF